MSLEFGKTRAALVVLVAILSPFIAVSRRPQTAEVELRARTGAGLAVSTPDGMDCAMYELLLPRHHAELPSIPVVTEQRPPRASA